MHRRGQRMFVAWMAALAVLMATLAPAISHAMGARSPTSWVEVCTSAGAKWVSVDDEAPRAPAAASLLEHCPYCALHADAAPPPPMPALPAPLALPAELPAAFLHAGKTLDVWASAQARAPPGRG